MAKLKCIAKRVVNNFSSPPYGEVHEFPLLGQVMFDDNAIIDVDDELVDDFLKIECGFVFEKFSKEAEDELNAEKNKAKEIEVSLYTEGLKELTEEEIDALISQYPKNKIKNLKSLEEKIDFLVKAHFKLK